MASKYQAWHDQIIERAKARKPLGCYKEVHHIKPRSLGGGDAASNLVDLTYREHFVVHWILTRICTGGALRRMQRALFAMTLPIGGRGQIAPWRIEVGRRAVNLLEDDPAVWESMRQSALAKRAERHAEQVTKMNLRRIERAAFKKALPQALESQSPGAVAHKLLRLHKRVSIKPFQFKGGDELGAARAVRRQAKNERLRMAAEMRDQLGLTIEDLKQRPAGLPDVEGGRSFRRPLSDDKLRRRRKQELKLAKAAAISQMERLGIRLKGAN